MTPDGTSSSILRLDGVSVVHDGRAVVKDLSFDLQSGERWAILGPNGCGKTTLLRVLSLYLHPTTGVISYRETPLGRFDVRSVRRRIAYSSASLAADLRPALIARDIVMTALHGALEAWWHEYDDNDRRRALACLEHLEIEALALRPFGTLSSGEQQRVLLARTLMCDPEVVLLDEPSARLDLGGRERLVTDIDALASTATQVPLVLVTHHVDEIPMTCTHAMLMREGVAIARGPIDQVVTSDNVSRCFDLELIVDRRANGRRTAHRA